MCSFVDNTQNVVTFLESTLTNNIKYNLKCLNILELCSSLINKTNLNELYTFFLSVSIKNKK